MAAAVDTAVLERRKREVAAFIRVTVSRDEAEAMATVGYRYLPCGGCGARTCRACDADPVEKVHAGGRRPSADPTFVTATINRLSMFESALYVGVPRALAGLEPEERIVLLLELGGGLSVVSVAERMKVSPKTVQRIRERALEAIVHEVWG